MSISYSTHTLRTLPSLLATLVLGLASCSSPYEVLTYDNPSIRKLQREHSTAVIPSKNTRQRLAKTCGPKVSFITSGNASRFGSASGRAAAISSDGYFLTAYHVVAQSPFFLSENKNNFTPEQQKQLNERKFLLYEKEPIEKKLGRLVWFDKGADLAIVKFDHSSPSYFKNLKFPSSVGEVVYSSDDQGIIALPSGATSTEDIDTLGIGNGPYFSAGSILFSQLFTHGPGVHTIGATLIARGGMSGGPIVNLEGELCGVLSLAGVSYSQGENEVKLIARSTSRMLPPSTLRSIIRQDRAKNGN